MISNKFEISTYHGKNFKLKVSPSFKDSSIIYHEQNTQSENKTPI